MDFSPKFLKTLLKDGCVELQDGVFLVSDGKVLKPTIYLKDDALIIEFEAPFLYLHVEKLGPKKLLNLVKPRVEYIKITDKSKLVKLSTLGEWEFGAD
jgi:hypothetical protein